MSNLFFGSVFSSFSIKSFAAQEGGMKVKNRGREREGRREGSYHQQRFDPTPLWGRSNPLDVFSSSCQERWELLPCCRTAGTHTVCMPGKKAHSPLGHTMVTTPCRPSIQGSTANIRYILNLYLPPYTSSTFGHLSADWGAFEIGNSKVKLPWYSMASRSHDPQAKTRPSS